MVYLEPSAFGWRPLLTSWLHSLHPALLEHQALILALVNWLVEPCLQLVFRKLKELVVTSESNLTRSLMYLFEMSMSSVCEDEKVIKDKAFKSLIVVSSSISLLLLLLRCFSFHCSQHFYLLSSGLLELHVMLMAMTLSMIFFVSCAQERWKGMKPHQL